jgi:hypothetical protein
MKKTLIVLLFTLVSTVFVLAATKEELEQLPRVGMTFDDLIKLYGQPSTSGKDRAYPDGFLSKLDILEPGDGYEISEQQLKEMQTTRFVNFSLPQLTITPFSVPLDQIKNKNFNKEQTVGIAVKPIQGVNLQLKDMGELFQFLTKCNKKLIRKSSIEQNPSIYYTQDKHYLVIFWYLDNHTSLKIIDLNLIHQAIGNRSPEAIQDKPRVGMTLDELKALYGEPNNRGKDNAYPSGFPTGDYILAVPHHQGIDSSDKLFEKMRTRPYIHFSLDKMTLTPIFLPTDKITNDQFNPDIAVGLHATPIKGISFSPSDMQDIFKAFTKSSKPLYLRSNNKKPEVYYSSDKRYVVLYWANFDHSIRIINRVLAHKAIEQKTSQKKKNIAEGL